jgi:hypothetical protein
MVENITNISRDGANARAGRARAPPTAGVYIELPEAPQENFTYLYVE